MSCCCFHCVVVAAAAAVQVSQQIAILPCSSQQEPQPLCDISGGVAKVWPYSTGTTSCIGKGPSLCMGVGREFSGGPLCLLHILHYGDSMQGLFLVQSGPICHAQVSLFVKNTGTLGWAYSLILSGQCMDCLYGLLAAVAIPAADVMWA